MSHIDRTIASLQPGQAARISGDDACWCSVERSGDGRTLRWVRHTRNGSTVFRAERF